MQDEPFVVKSNIFETTTPSYLKEIETAFHQGRKVIFLGRPFYSFGAFFEFLQEHMFSKAQRTNEEVRNYVQKIQLRNLGLDKLIFPTSGTSSDDTFSFKLYGLAQQDIDHINGFIELKTPITAMSPNNLVLTISEIKIQKFNDYVSNATIFLKKINA